MTSNRGYTTLRKRRRAGRPMRDFDGLPPELRGWLTQAKLPWGVASAQRSYARALRRTGSCAAALAEMDRLQERLLCRDAAAVWGTAYPVQAPPGAP
ncbi:MAG: DUF6525 family protein [Pseudomonadota bacterium]